MEGSPMDPFSFTATPQPDVVQQPDLVVLEPSQSTVAASKPVTLLPEVVPEIPTLSYPILSPEDVSEFPLLPPQVAAGFPIFSPEILTDSPISSSEAVVELPKLNESTDTEELLQVQDGPASVSAQMLDVSETAHQQKAETVANSVDSTTVLAAAAATATVAAVAAATTVEKADKAKATSAVKQRPTAKPLASKSPAPTKSVPKATPRTTSKPTQVCI